MSTSTLKKLTNYRQHLRVEDNWTGEGKDAEAATVTGPGGVSILFQSH